MFSFFKRTFALAVSFIMALCIIPLTEILADESGNISVNNAIIGEKYQLYKVFDLTYSGSLTAPTYKKQSSDPFFDALISAESPFELTRIMSTDEYVVTYKSGYSSTDSHIIDFLKSKESLLDGRAISSANLDGNSCACGTTIQWNSVSFGYYWLSSSAGLYVMLDSTTPNITITEKNSVPTFTAYQKSRIEDNFTDHQISGTINDPVYYQIQITPGKGNNKAMNIVSELTNLHSISGVNVTLTRSGETPQAIDSTSYTQTVSDTDNRKLAIRFSDTFVSTLADTDVLTIEYQAILSKNAKVIGEQIDANNNTITFQYSNQTSNQTLLIETTKITITKADSQSKVLNGAIVRIYRESAGGTALRFKNVNDNYLISDPSGTEDIKLSSSDIKGLATGKYYIEEVEAPKGYQKLTQRMEITVDGNNTGRIDGTTVTGGFIIVNKPGITLPASGSSSFLVLTITGCITMAAGIFLVLHHRRHV